MPYNRRRRFRRRNSRLTAVVGNLNGLRGTRGTRRPSLSPKLDRKLDKSGNGITGSTPSNDAVPMPISDLTEISPMKQNGSKERRNNINISNHEPEQSEIIYFDDSGVEDENGDGDGDGDEGEEILSSPPSFHEIKEDEMFNSEDLKCKSPEEIVSNC